MTGLGEKYEMLSRSRLAEAALPHKAGIPMGFS
jgi:hypothetical protein